MNMPSTVNDTVRIEFLLRDILVFGVNLDNFVEIEKDDYQIYLFNLDSIIEAREAKTPPEIINIANDMAERIAGFVPEKTIVHSNLLDARLPSIFEKTGAFFLRENLYDDRHMVGHIEKLLRNFLSFEAFGKRAFIRVMTNTTPAIKVQLETLKGESQRLDGTLVDISMNGAGVAFKSSAPMAHIKLKDIVRVKIIFPRHLARIQTALVTRFDHENFMIGINFDCNDPRMVDSEQANALSSFIYQAIKHSMGKLEKASV